MYFPSGNADFTANNEETTYIYQYLLLGVIGYAVSQIHKLSHAQLLRSKVEERIGEESSVEATGAAPELNPNAISVTAKLAETLPDTYTFFDDWRQKEYRLLRMETVRLLKGRSMTDWWREPPFWANSARRVSP